MTDKELRRCSRRELIEMLYYIRKELDAVRAENESLRTRLDAFVEKALAAQADAAELTDCTPAEQFLLDEKRH